MHNDNRTFSLNGSKWQNENMRKFRNCKIPVVEIRLENKTVICKRGTTL